MRYLIGSQWRFMRVSVIYSPSLVHVRSLADEFWTYWILSRALQEFPNRTPLQEASRVVTKTRMIICYRFCVTDVKRCSLGW